MASAPNVLLGYDGLGQLALVSPQAPVAKLDYLLIADGVPHIESNSATGLLRRHVHGPGTDEPLLTYEGTGLTDKRYLHADERGSIIAISNGSGTVTQINAYDDYGIPQGKSAAGAVISGGTDTTTANFGRFGYTGQVWLPEVGLYHYKARAYSPTLGRFMQTDPIGYEDGVNLYAYVGGDPINFSDPSGLSKGPKEPFVRTEPINCPPALFVACPQGRREREQGRSEGSVGFSRGDAVGRERGGESGGGGRGGGEKPPAPEMPEPPKAEHPRRRGQIG